MLLFEQKYVSLQRFSSTIAMNKTVRIVLAILGLAVAIAAAAGVWAWNEMLRKPAVTETTWVYVTDSEISDADLLQGTKAGCAWGMTLARMLTHVDDKLQSGKLEGAYRLPAGMPALRVAQKLARHQQDAVRMTFSGTRLKEQLAGRMARNLLCDSLDVLSAMTDTAFLRRAGVDEANVGTIFLPDTYEVYWNITPQKLMERMLKEYERYWNAERSAKAEALGLTPREVAILASIAEEETASRSERGVVGRLYLNRLQCGMMLQADPTVKFALGDFGLKRILLRHLEVDSPYNTYRYAGLPPGPIRIPEKATIDSILNSNAHSYLYMCAKPDFSGRHNFAETLSEHMRNAEAYHRALNERR